MTFVFTFWYFVMILLVGGIVASLLVFFKMDKKDKVLIDEFIKEAQAAQQEQPANEQAEEVKE